MNAYTALCTEVLFPVHEWLKGHESVRVRKALEASQWWTLERINAQQVSRLRAFLVEIGQRVPYYRDLFQAHGFNPAAVSSVDDLTRLPCLGKAEIRANFERLVADGATRLSRSNTGGSSGEPLVFYTGVRRRSHDVAAKWRATRWWGVNIGDPEIVVWGSPIEIGTQDRIRTLRDSMLRSSLLPAFDMSEAALDRYISTIRAKRPSMLFGYPSSLAFIADHARKRGIAMDRLGIRVAFVTSERLYDDQRQTISAVFGCPVANGYGGRDAGFIAHECPSGRLHISAEDIVVEILDSENNPVTPGTPGEIVVTHMASGDFPFVRYRTGDVGAIDSTEACPCGRGLPVLKELQGRSTDFVVAYDGTVMHGLALIYVLRSLPGIERFKIIQHDLSHTDVFLVLGPGNDAATTERRIQTEFRQRLGSQVEVTVHMTDAIPSEANGKYRYVVSKVARSDGSRANARSEVAHA